MRRGWPQINARYLSISVTFGGPGGGGPRGLRVFCHDISIPPLFAVSAVSPRFRRFSFTPFYPIMPTSCNRIAIVSCASLQFRPLKIYYIASAMCTSLFGRYRQLPSDAADIQIRTNPLPCISLWAANTSPGNARSRSPPIRRGSRGALQADFRIIVGIDGANRLVLGISPPPPPSGHGDFLAGRI